MTILEKKREQAGQLKSIPLDYFVCPETKKPLKMQENRLISPTGKVYNFKYNQFWSFMPEVDTENDPKWKIWDQLQKNGEISYPMDPENNLGVSKRPDHIAFGDFCDFRGLVLDIGSGPQKNPTHFKYCARPGAVFFGIDPLVGEQPRDYLFVHGLGEYLPFKRDLFDQALFVTSLDHFMDPIEALIEAARVIKPGGDVCVWIGEKDKNAPRPATSHQWYEEMQVPEGAEDRFHYKRFDAGQFEDFVKQAGLRIEQKEMMIVDEYRRNMFYKLSK